MNYLDCISVANMRESDRKTIEGGVPSLTLMYRAAMGVYRAAAWHGDIAIAVGSGNNGGDGFALAYILKSNGIGCRVVTLSDRLSPDSAHFAQRAKALGVPVAPYAKGAFADADVVVDCLLGTGFHGAVREPYASAIREVNAAGARVISVDINSGMNGDTGEAALAVRSDLTVTIGFVKNGMLAANAGDHMKRLVVTDIGIILDRAENKIAAAWPDDRATPENVLPCPAYLDMTPIDTRDVAYASRETEHMDVLRDCFEAEARTAITQERDKPKEDDCGSGR
ncbi:MAG: NAD(P)H-hydrate epimerase [Oscillospiraceae bacterium]|nr:NAD(P)H-hydrate epimerase [Oscillospiraceae bacterium]